MKRKPVKVKKTILIYGVPPLQLLALSAAAEEKGILCKPVSDRQTTCSIAQLLSGKELPEGGAFPLFGKFALLAGFGGQPDEAIELINSITPGVIKAVHNQQNDRWRFSDLCMHIHLEHKQMKRMP